MALCSCGACSLAASDLSRRTYFHRRCYLFHALLARSQVCESVEDSRCRGLRLRLRFVRLGLPTHQHVPPWSMTSARAPVFDGNTLDYLLPTGDPHWNIGPVNDFAGNLNLNPCPQVAGFGRRAAIVGLDSANGVSVLKPRRVGLGFRTNRRLDELLCE